MSMRFAPPPSPTTAVVSNRVAGAKQNANAFTESDANASSVASTFKLDKGAASAEKTYDPNELNTVITAIRKHVGGIEQVLRAENDKSANVDAYAEALTKRIGPAPGPKGSPAYNEWLNTELEEQIEKAAKALIDQGIKTGDSIDELAAKAWHADLGTTFLKGITSNAVAYGSLSLLILAITLPLTIALGPIAVIPIAIASLGLAVYGTYKFSVHALAAASGVNKEFDNRKGRRRFSKVADAPTLGKAVGTALVADAARTGIRSLVQVPLRILTTLLSVLQVSAPAATGLGYALGPIALLMGPPTNGLMQVCHQALLGRKGRTMAPMFGIDLNKKDLSLDCKTDVAQRSVERLSKPTHQRVWNSACRLGTAYTQNFGDKYTKEKERGMTIDKWSEMLFGGNTFGPALNAVGAVGAGVGIVGATAGAGLKLGLGIASVATGATNFLTQAPVHRNSNFLQKAKAREQEKYDKKHPPNPGSTGSSCNSRCRAPWE